MESCRTLAKDPPYRADGQSNLIIFEEKAEVVLVIFEMRASGNTLQRIADHLNSVSIPARRGGRWHPATVRYILDNPKYRGQVEYFFRWQDEQARVISEGNHEAIVNASENPPEDPMSISESKTSTGYETPI
jgi:hypothetical protein